MVNRTLYYEIDDFGFGQKGKNDEHEIECGI